MARKKQKKVRRQWSDEQKIDTVSRLKSGSSIIAEAERLNVSRTVIDKWARDPRYSRRGAKRNAAPLEAGLPTKERAVSKRAKPLVATGFACPHCGGLLEVAA